MNYSRDLERLKRMYVGIIIQCETKNFLINAYPNPFGRHKNIVHRGCTSRQMDLFLQL
jgi:hypothetical protein